MTSVLKPQLWRQCVSRRRVPPLASSFKALASGTMPVQMNGSPPKVGGLASTHTGARGGGDGVAKSMSGGDLMNKTVYKGPKHKKDSRYMTTGPIADIGSGGSWSTGQKAQDIHQNEDGTWSGSQVQDKRTRFEQKFDDEQAKWMDNEDRNDDALYHRSFDDGSMHLFSSAFRDGKPVDNHGKAIGGMGAPPVNKYRRHDTQKAMLTGESVTHVNIGDEMNPHAQYFEASEIKNHERGWVHPDMAKKGAKPWDPIVKKSVPYACRGQKVLTNEPWIEDVKADAEADMATSCLNRLDDGQNDSVVLVFQRRREENAKIAENRGLMPWHASPVLWRFPSGQEGRSIEYGETAATLKNEYKYTSHIQNGHNMELDQHIGSTDIMR